MNEYRCTRNGPYRDPNCPGHKDLSARCGTYIAAASEEDALKRMKEKWPNDSHGFTVTLWARV